MSPANAALTPVQRLRIGRLIVDDGWPVAHAAVFFHVSWATAKRWAARHPAQRGRGLAIAGLVLGYCGIVSILF